MRRRNPDEPRHLTDSLLTLHQRREKQLDFTETGRLEQYFDERCRRPTTAG
jgi:hypothetical protein